MKRLGITSVLIGLLLLLLTSTTPIQANPSNHPVFVTLDKAQEMIDGVISSFTESLFNLTNRTELLEQQVADLETRVGALEDLLTPTPTPTSAVDILLLDNFDGMSLDNNIWDVFINEGNISFADGYVALSAGSAMPFIRLRNNPFPASGPFTVEFGIQYLTQAEGGSGVGISFSQQENTADSFMWPNNPLALWQDNVGFGLVGSGSYLLTISPNDFNYNVVKISYDGSKYVIQVDENIIYTSPNTARVGGLWFGHPNYCCTSGWTSFKLNYIKITQL